MSASSSSSSSTSLTTTSSIDNHQEDNNITHLGTEGTVSSRNNNTVYHYRPTTAVSWTTTRHPSRAQSPAAGLADAASLSNHSISSTGTRFIESELMGPARRRQAYVQVMAAHNNSNRTNSPVVLPTTTTTTTTTINPTTTPPPSASNSPAPLTSVPTSAQKRPYFHQSTSSQDSNHTATSTSSSASEGHFDDAVTPILSNSRSSVTSNRDVAQQQIFSSSALPPHILDTFQRFEYASCLPKFCHIILPILLFYHVPSQIFIDYNVIYILVQVARSSSNAWWVAVAAYSLCTFLWLIGVVLFYEIIFPLLRLKNNLSKASDLNTYFSASLNNMSRLANYSVYCYFSRLRRSAWFGISTLYKPHQQIAFTETCFWYCQNWPTVFFLIPRAILSLNLLINIPSEKFGIIRDPSYFKNNDQLSVFSQVILYINCIWGAWRLLVLIISWIGILLTDLSLKDFGVGGGSNSLESTHYHHHNHHHHSNASVVTYGSARPHSTSSASEKIGKAASLYIPGLNRLRKHALNRKNCLIYNSQGLYASPNDHLSVLAPETINKTLSEKIQQEQEGEEQEHNQHQHEHDNENHDYPEEFHHDQSSPTSHVLPPISVTSHQLLDDISSSDEYTTTSSNDGDHGGDNHQQEYQNVHDDTHHDMVVIHSPQRHSVDSAQQLQYHHHENNIDISNDNGLFNIQQLQQQEEENFEFPKRTSAASLFSRLVNSVVPSRRNSRRSDSYTAYQRRSHLGNSQRNRRRSTVMSQLAPRPKSTPAIMSLPLPMTSSPPTSPDPEKLSSSSIFSTPQPPQPVPSRHYVHASSSASPPHPQPPIQPPHKRTLSSIRHSVEGGVSSRPISSMTAEPIMATAPSSIPFPVIQPHHHHRSSYFRKHEQQQQHNLHPTKNIIDNFHKRSASDVIGQPNVVVTHRKSFQSSSPRQSTSTLSLVNTFFPDPAERNAALYLMHGDQLPSATAAQQQQQQQGSILDYNEDDRNYWKNRLKQMMTYVPSNETLSNQPSTSSAHDHTHTHQTFDTNITRSDEDSSDEEEDILNPVWLNARTEHPSSSQARPEHHHQDVFSSDNDNSMSQDPDDSQSLISHDHHLLQTQQGRQEEEDQSKEHDSQFKPKLQSQSQSQRRIPPPQQQQQHHQDGDSDYDDYEFTVSNIDDLDHVLALTTISEEQEDSSPNSSRQNSDTKSSSINQYRSANVSTSSGSGASGNGSAPGNGSGTNSQEHSFNSNQATDNGHNVTPSKKSEKSKQSTSPSSATASSSLSSTFQHFPLTFDQSRKTSTRQHGYDPQDLKLDQQKSYESIPSTTSAPLIDQRPSYQTMSQLSVPSSTDITTNRRRSLPVITATPSHSSLHLSNSDYSSDNERPRSTILLEQTPSFTSIQSGNDNNNSNNALTVNTNNDNATSDRSTSFASRSYRTAPSSFSTDDDRIHH